MSAQAGNSPAIRIVRLGTHAIRKKDCVSALSEGRRAACARRTMHGAIISVVQSPTDHRFSLNYEPQTINLFSAEAFLSVMQ